jgi:hypothetical protein
MGVLCFNSEESNPSLKFKIKFYYTITLLPCSKHITILLLLVSLPPKDLIGNEKIFKYLKERELGEIWGACYGGV